jgi:hypothetical protein
VCGSYSYTGDWVNDEMHGQGRFTFASGASYQGCFENNRFQGVGRYTFSDGKLYSVSAGCVTQTQVCDAQQRTRCGSSVLRVLRHPEQPAAPSGSSSSCACGHPAPLTL